LPGPIVIGEMTPSARLAGVVPRSQASAICAVFCRAEAAQNTPLYCQTLFEMVVLFCRLMEGHPMLGHGADRQCHGRCLAQGNRPRPCSPGLHARPAAAVANSSRACAWSSARAAK
jgi:hypothetical protein